jgi:pyruvate,orthophosphate dikinase
VELDISQIKPDESLAADQRNERGVPMTAVDLPLLRAIGLKGMANGDVIAAALRTNDGPQRVAAALDAGLVRELARGFALTPPGREAVAEALAQEAAGIDRAAMALIYDAFCTLNDVFKALMHRWQIRLVDGEEQPNDHTDAGYDAAIIAELGEVDSRIRPLLTEIVALAPRLSPASVRFADALEAVRGGDNAMFGRPLVDSYHTVWFELHEELITLSGRTRAEEAAAGRGA